MRLGIRHVVGAACLLALLAGYAWASVTFDYDHAADFSGYTSYAWMERDNSVESQLPEHLRLRLRRVTEDVLADKGFDPAPALPQADLLLTFYYGAKDELAVSFVSWGPYSPWGYGYWGGRSYGYTDVRKYKEGTLVLDIVDAHTHQLVWTGVMEKEVRSVNPSGKRIQKTINKLLKNFPPTK